MRPPRSPFTLALALAHSSGLLDTNVPENEKLYGYHRLEDPLVQSHEGGGLLITRQSKVEPPEPLDQNPVIFGRHDHQQINGREYKNV